MNLQLLTPAARGAYLERVQHDIASAEHFILVTAFATSEGITLLYPAMRKCLEAGGQGTLVLALDRQHFNAAELFEKLAELVESFPERLEVRIVRERAGLLHAKAVFAKRPDGTATLLVGSANLTERAFTQNHELGLWVNLLGKPEVSRSFQLFAQSLDPLSALPPSCAAKKDRRIVVPRMGEYAFANVHIQQQPIVASLKTSRL